MPILRSYFPSVKAVIVFYDLKNKASYKYIADVMKELPAQTEAQTEMVK
jgi:hypothetical protein